MIPFPRSNPTPGVGFLRKRKKRGEGMHGHVAIFLPGGGYTVDHPLLWYARRALKQVGAIEVLVDYDDPRDDDVFHAGVERDVKAALKKHEPTRLTLVGKSLGTQAIAHIVGAGLPVPAHTRAVWMSPVWKWDHVWQGALACTWPSLYAVGLADSTAHDPKRHAELSGTTVAIERGNHSLEIEGDAVASLDALRRVTEAVLEHAR